MQRYSIIVDFIKLEAWIIGLFLILTYCYYFYFYLMKLKRVKVEAELNDALQEMRNNGKYKPLKHFNHVGSVMRIIEIYNEKFEETEAWNACIIKIMSQQLLPIARTYLHKKNWMKKYILLKCYKLYIEPCDEDNLIQLINSERPIISINAILVASKIASVAMYKTIIYRLRDEEKPFQVLNISQMKNSKMLHDVLYALLKKEKDPLTRKICYMIISRVSNGSEFYEFATSDTHTDNLELRITAINTLPFTDQQKAFDDLSKMLSDPDWLIRNATVNALGHIQHPTVIPCLVSALNDKESWVRTNAAKVLSLHSEASRQVLSQQGVDDSLIQKKSKYFLSINEVKKEHNNG